MRIATSNTQSAPNTTSFLALAVATALMFALPVAAQQTAFASSGGQAKVRASVGLTMPVLMRFTPTAQPIATVQAEHHTEYVISYSVATNSRWEVTVGNLPKGVTVLADNGSWVDSQSSQVVVRRGEPTNPTEVLVRVRIADGTAASWRSDLTIAASRAGF